MTSFLRLIWSCIGVVALNLRVESKDPWDWNTNFLRVDVVGTPEVVVEYL